MDTYTLSRTHVDALKKKKNGWNHKGLPCWMMDYKTFEMKRCDVEEFIKVMFVL